MWFRRDLRLRDHPALRTAADSGDVLGLFVLDPALWGSAGPARRAWLAATLRSLDDSMGGRLCVRVGRPASVVPLMAERVGADQVHVTNDFTPYGRARDRAVVEALPDHVEGVATGTPYAVAPGTVVNGSGNPYKVFTPYSKAWRSHGWDDPLPAPRNVEWVQAEDDQRVEAMLDKALREAPDGMPTPGEDAAWRRFRALPGPRRRRVRRPARRPRRRPDLATLALPEVRRPPPAPAARRDRSEAEHRGDHLRDRAGLARLLRRRPLHQPRLGLERPQPRRRA